jgi:hypothetical protein
MNNNERPAETAAQTSTEAEVTPSAQLAAIPLLPDALSVEDGNSLICQFEGYRNMIERCFPDADENETFVTGELQYNLSWEWLMPVVEKIESEYNGEVMIYNCCCDIGIFPANCDSSNTIVSIDYPEAKSKIEAVWIAIYKFIQWYNENKTVSKR